MNPSAESADVVGVVAPLPDKEGSGEVAFRSNDPAASPLGKRGGKSVDLAGNVTSPFIAPVADAPTRVLVDARMMLGRFSGVARFVTSLVDHLANEPDIELFMLCGDTPHAPWQDCHGVTMLTSTFSRRDRTAVRRLVWEQRHLRRIIRENRIDVYHATWNTGVPAWAEVPSILTIHDLIPFRNAKEHFGGVWQRLAYRYSLRAAARRAGAITTVSDHVRRQVIHHLGVSPERVTRIYNGVEHPATTRNEVAADPPYVLYVGGHEPRKNVAAVLRCMQAYWNVYGPSPELRLTGAADALCPKARAEYDKMPADAPVRFLHTVTDAQLNELYQGATALLMLSFDEGFGLPVAEAMAHGCPVIAADQSALPEIAGGAGRLVAPDDTEAIVQEIRLLVSSAGHREDLRLAGLARADTFSWAQTAREFARLYRKLAQERRPAVQGTIHRTTTV